MPVKRPRLSQEWPRRVCRNSERESWGFLGPIAFRALSVALGPPLQRSRGVSGVIMPHLAIYTALSLSFVGALPAEAQTRTLLRNGEVLILSVRPRSDLDAGNVVPVGSEKELGHAPTRDGARDFRSPPTGDRPRSPRPVNPERF